MVLRTLLPKILTGSLQMSAQPPNLGYTEVLLHTHTHTLDTSILAVFSFTKTVIILSMEENDSNVFHIIAKG